jgi:predicted N-acyltransferase
MIEIVSSNTFHNITLPDVDRMSHNPFLDLKFLLALEDSNSIGKDTGWIAFPIIAKKNNETVGFMPIFLKEHSYGEYVFDWAWAEAFHQNGLNYYPKMLCGIPFTPITGPRIYAHDIEVKKILIKALEKILEEHGISSCHILFPDEKDHKLLNQSGWLSRHGVQFKWQNKNYNNFDDFLATLTHNKRKKIRQERKKIKNSNICITQKTGEKIKTEDIDFFYQCYCNTYREHHSSPYLTNNFFHRLLKVMPEKLLLVEAEVEDKRVASAFNVIGSETLYGRYWGALKYIPGLHFELCYYQGQEFCIKNKLEFFEGGAQGEHKLARGFEPFSTYSNHYISNQDFRVAIENFLDAESGKIHEYSNELDDRKPFKKA